VFYLCNNYLLEPLLEEVDPPLELEPDDELFPPLLLVVVLLGLVLLGVGFVVVRFDVEGVLLVEGGLVTEGCLVVDGGLVVVGCLVDDGGLVVGCLDVVGGLDVDGICLLVVGGFVGLYFFTYVVFLRFVLFDSISCVVVVGRFVIEVLYFGVAFRFEVTGFVILACVGRLELDTAFIGLLFVPGLVLLTLTVFGKEVLLFEREPW